MDRAKELRMTWESRLSQGYPAHHLEKRQTIVRWLTENPLDCLPGLSSDRATRLEHRYQILQQHYLDVQPNLAYRRLLDRLGSPLVCHPQIHRWLKQDPSYQKVAIDLLGQLIDYLLHKDEYIEQQTGWIAQCTQDTHLRNALLLTTLEEYCLSSVNDSPRIIGYLIAFLKQQRWGKKIIPHQLDSLPTMFKVMYQDCLKQYHQKFMIS